MSMHHPHLHAEDDAPKAEGELPAPPPRAQRMKHFFREFLSVMMAVLLALIVEQAAEYWRERERVLDTRESMNEEAADFAEIFTLRLRLAPRTRRKLDQLDGFIAGKGPSAPVRDVGRPSYFFASR